MQCAHCMCCACALQLASAQCRPRLELSCRGGIVLDTCQHSVSTWQLSIQLLQSGPMFLSCICQPKWQAYFYQTVLMSCPWTDSPLVSELASQHQQDCCLVQLAQQRPKESGTRLPAPAIACCQHRRVESCCPHSAMEPRSGHIQHWCQHTWQRLTGHIV